MKWRHYQCWEKSIETYWNNTFSYLKSGSAKEYILDTAVLVLHKLFLNPTLFGPNLNANVENLFWISWESWILSGLTRSPICLSLALWVIDMTCIENISRGKSTQGQRPEVITEIDLPKGANISHQRVRSRGLDMTYQRKKFEFPQRNTSRYISSVKGFAWKSPTHFFWRDEYYSIISTIRIWRNPCFGQRGGRSLWHAIRNNYVYTSHNFHLTVN